MIGNLLDNWFGCTRVFPRCVCRWIGGLPRACITGCVEVFHLGVDVSMLDWRLGVCVGEHFACFGFGQLGCVLWVVRLLCGWITGCIGECACVWRCVDAGFSVLCVCTCAM